MNAFLLNFQRSINSGVNWATVEGSKQAHSQSLTDSFCRAPNLNLWKYVYLVLNWRNIFNMIIMWGSRFSVWRWSIGEKAQFTSIRFVVLLSTKGTLFCEEGHLAQRGKKDGSWIFIENACWAVKKTSCPVFVNRVLLSHTCSLVYHGLWLFTVEKLRSCTGDWRLETDWLYRDTNT